MAEYRSKHQPEVDRYVQDVLSGKIAAGELERAAVQRYVDDLANAEQRGFYHDAREADRVINFMQLQKHTTGEFDGKPFLLFPYQKFIVWNLFGWRQIEDDLRRFRKCYYSVGRGNGKSPFAALLMLTLACFDNPPEPRAELVLAATERRQTKYVADEIARMIRRQPALARRFEIYNSRIVYSENGTYIEQLGKEAKSKDGMNLHGFVADELHEWREEHRAVLDKLQTSMGKRRQPLEILITTAGSDHSVVWIDIYEDACKVARRVYENDRWFVFICQMDEGDDPFDETVWRKGNPNLDVSVKLDYLRSLANEARHNAVKLNQFLRYHMNVRVRSLVKVIKPEHWRDATVPLTDEQLAQKLCCAGLDMGWRDDLASLTACFQLGTKEHPLYALKSWSWICAETDKRDLTQPPWSEWIRKGFLSVTEGNTTDPAAIYRQVGVLRTMYQLKTVALDPNNARAIGIHLVNELGIEVFEFFQTCRKYNEPTKTLLTLLTDGRIVHDGNPLLAWAADNLCLKTDAAGNVMPDKSKSTDKIDPIVAAIMGLSELMFHDADATGGYNVHEFRTL